MEEGDGGGVTGGGEMAGLVDEFFGEVESGQVAISFVPEAEGDASGAAAGLEQGGVFVGEETFDEEPLGFPEAEKMRGACVVNDGEWVVEVGADGLGGDLFHASNVAEVTEE